MSVNKSEFDRQTALVTGGAQGIGRGIAETLASYGCTVVINDIQQARLEETAAELTDVRGDVVGLEADVSDPEEVEVLFDEIEDRFGGLDVLVNNAAIIDPAEYDEISHEGWRRVLSVNLDGVHHCCSIGAPLIAGSGGGSIINVSSIAGKRISVLAGAHYTTSKWGVIGLTKHVAEEYGPRDVRVNAICPGPIETDTMSGLNTSDRHQSVDKGDIPLRQMGDPSDIGRAVIALSSNLMSFVTGTTLVVDGGYTIR
ncbi:SDR family NAD(P)-dependent oxidoreductase [Halococcus salifodinae]|uniref:3-oxoacyl-ACP reductase n=1 Tax=Halococcus salifodinae DSM 8989 TaxID=1227456 RepID=M0N9X0_9EURY|nr:SDR family NAD(P)-dependent oxidoreductase [Halococcus salifodinae]EMA54757.1 3-oxoacyl-ACP reductase [Halococcus salifodinae DSM 8989]